MAKKSTVNGGERVPRGRNAVPPTLLDRAVGYFSPEAGLRRLHARGTMLALQGGQGGYDGGKRGRRNTTSWRAGGGSADADSLPELPELRSRSRDLGRNSPLAGGAINTNVTNVIGPGLRLQAQLDREYLNLSDDQAEAWERAAEREFQFWSQRESCDITGVQSFDEMQQTAFRGVLESGDIFVSRRFDGGADRRYGLALQLIEADRCQQPNDMQDGQTLAGSTHRVSGGVESNADGKVRAFWMLKNHPGDLIYAGREWVRYPKYGHQSGQVNILHLYDRLRPNQSRGVPYLAPVIEILKQLDRYTDAEIDAAVVSSFFTVFTKTENAEGLDPVSSGGLVSGNPHSGARSGDDDAKLAPGAMIDLNLNESVEFADPSRPNAGFDPFVTAVLRQIGVVLELPFEILIKHFTASYSAARAAIIEAVKYFRKRRLWIAARLCQPVYEWLLFEAVARGRINAPGFLTDPMVRFAYCGARWNGPGQPPLNPRQEVEALALQEDRGWMTAQQVTAELNGTDWTRNVGVRAGELRRKKDAGLGVEGTADRVVSESAAPAPGSDAEKKEDN